MRPAVVAVLILFAASALGATGLPSFFSEAQTCTTGTCTRSAAPVSNAEGMGLKSVRGYRVSACAATGQTLSGAGTLQAYWCDAISGLCMRNKDLDLSVSASGVQCQVWADFQVGQVTQNLDSVVFAASSVTVSGGATLTVRIYPYVR